MLCLCILNGILIFNKKDIVLGKNENEITKAIIQLLDNKLTTLNLQ